MFIEEYLTEGVFLCSSEINTDNRGQFMELYNNEVLKKFGVSSFIQQNLVKSSKFVIRGMHWQSQPFEQAKFITVISGKILDVFIDMRFESKTYKKIYALQLNSTDAHSIFIPTGSLCLVSSFLYLLNVITQYWPYDFNIKKKKFKR